MADFPTFDTDWESEAYASVSGQNANNSVTLRQCHQFAFRSARRANIAISGSSGAGGGSCVRIVERSLGVSPNRRMSWSNNR